MKVIDPGHKYELNWLDGTPFVDPMLKDNVLMFVKRQGDGYPGNVGAHPGTNMQEVLRALIDRVKYLDKQIPNAHNGHVLVSLRNAIVHLEMRAAQRHGRVIELASRNVEEYPTCPKCGHIGCEGKCHV